MQRNTLGRIVLVSAWLLLLVLTVVGYRARHQADLDRYQAIADTRQAETTAREASYALERELHDLQRGRTAGTPQQLLEEAAQLMPELEDGEINETDYGLSLEGYHPALRADVTLTARPNGRWHSTLVWVDMQRFPDPPPTARDRAIAQLDEAMLSRFWIGDTFIPYALILYLLIVVPAALIRPARPWLALLAGVVLAGFVIATYAAPEHPAASGGVRKLNLAAYQMFAKLMAVGIVGLIVLSGCSLWSRRADQPPQTPPGDAGGGPVADA